MEQEKTIYELLSDKVRDEFIEYRKEFLESITNGIFHDSDCFDFTIRCDISDYIIEADIDELYEEEQVVKLLKLDNTLEALADKYEDYGLDYIEAINYALSEVTKG